MTKNLNFNSKYETIVSKLMNTDNKTDHKFDLKQSYNTFYCSQKSYAKENKY